MSDQERQELIVAIGLRAKYSAAYLESLSDEELNELYDRLSGDGHVH